MANKALTRAIVWRRLAAFRRHLRPPAGPTPPPTPDGSGRPGGDFWLTPIVVDYFGRDGSTSALKLLSSAPEIIVEGAYPFESQQLSRALETGNPVDAWTAYGSRLIAGADPRPRYCAEKMLDARRLPAGISDRARTIVLLRDPRDTYVSIEAFSRAVGTEEIGGEGGEEDRLNRFVLRQRERLEWILDLDESERLTVARYEDLVGSLPAIASRLSGWLGVELDAAEVAADFRLRWIHGTSRDPASSVGRWREELSEPVTGRLRRELGDPMAQLGFADWDR